MKIYLISKLPAMNALLALSGMQVNLNFREANESDVPALVDLLADDVLGTKREDISIPLNSNYLDAFHSIEADSNNELTVVESDGELVGMLQLTFIPYLTHIGSWRCLIEGVRIANTCLLYTSPSPRDATLSRMPSSA